MGTKTPPSANVVHGRCPICGEPSEMRTRPFCSKRCRDIDLSRWLKGTYAIPGGQVEADEDGEEAAFRSRERQGEHGGGQHGGRSDDADDDA